ncbi:unnamed protein product [Boreogadus saida]
MFRPVLLLSPHTYEETLAPWLMPGSPEVRTLNAPGEVGQEDRSGRIGCTGECILRLEMGCFDVVQNEPQRLADPGLSLGSDQMKRESTGSCFVSAPPTVRIVHSGHACNVEEERHTERVYTIREGETLELTCLVTGHPRPQGVTVAIARSIRPRKILGELCALLLTTS